MQAAEQLEAQILALADVPCNPAGMDDRRLLEDCGRWERIGRLADARRVALAGEVAWRSREQIGDASLAKQHGDRDASDLLARELRIGVREARRRTALGVRVRTRLTVTGDEVPGRWPRVAQALADGVMGCESARVILDMLASVAHRADAVLSQVAEAALVESALVMVRICSESRPTCGRRPWTRTGRSPPRTPRTATEACVSDPKVRTGSPSLFSRRNRK